ncbi:uncharacterized protein ARMOST_02507 [Armillaria ostoyae]|uniref:Uncharacterized protein n=1 Tax=Armillaria ostoyae TaxID=47428 RepID=A0A284QRX3_ARMOS|nr:uncharacterized protein ARMOST_02507 [Armillaria ostoyae]
MALAGSRTQLANSDIATPLEERDALIDSRRGQAEDRTLAFGYVSHTCSALNSHHDHGKATLGKKTLQPAGLTRTWITLAILHGTLETKVQRSTPRLFHLARLSRNDRIGRRRSRPTHCVPSINLSPCHCIPPSAMLARLPLLASSTRLVSIQHPRSQVHRRDIAGCSEGRGTYSCRSASNYLSRARGAEVYGTTGIDDSSSTPTDNPLPLQTKQMAPIALSSHSFRCRLCVLLTVPPQPSLTVSTAAATPPSAVPYDRFKLLSTPLNKLIKRWPEEARVSVVAWDDLWSIPSRDLMKRDSPLLQSWSVFRHHGIKDNTPRPNISASTVMGCQRIWHDRRIRVLSWGAMIRSDTGHSSKTGSSSVFPSHEYGPKHHVIVPVPAF